jgi:thiol:disulfide interchange protein DsbD
MEINIFPDPGVREQLKRYVRLQLYTDTSEESARKYQRMQAERFGTVALPFYAILRPDGSAVATHGGLMRDPERFARFLRQGFEKAAAARAADQETEEMSAL